MWLMVLGSADQVVAKHRPVVRDQSAANWRDQRGVHRLNRGSAIGCTTGWDRPIGDRPAGLHGPRRHVQYSAHARNVCTKTKIAPRRARRPKRAPHDRLAPAPPRQWVVHSWVGGVSVVGIPALAAEGASKRPREACASRERVEARGARQPGKLAGPPGERDAVVLHEGVAVRNGPCVQMPSV
jgi:hypothetical protein